MTKCKTILLKGFSGLLLSLLSAGFIGITSANATITTSDIKYFYALENTSEFFGLKNATLRKGHDDPQFTTGKWEDGVLYDSSVSNLWAADNSNFGVTEEENFTLSAWYKHLQDPSIEGHIFVQGSIEDVHNYAENLGFHVHGTAENTDHLSIDCDESGTRQWTSTNTVFNDNNWHNYVVKGQIGRPLTYKIYVDGSEISGSWNNSTNYTPKTEYPFIDVGNRFNNYSVYGMIDEVAMFDRQLTDTEITSLQSQSLATMLTPVSNNYVMYYGNDPAYGKINERLSMPVVYNICDNWSSTSTFQIKLKATSTDELLATANVLNNCSGTITFNGTAAATESSQYAYFSIEKNGTELIKSDQFLFTIYEPLINTDNWINSDLSSPLYIDYTTTNTTTAKITYRIFYSNIASTSICLIRKDQNNNKTALCNSSALTEGLNSFNLEIPSANFETSQVISFGLFEGNTLLLESPSVMMNFYKPINNQDDWENQFGTSTTAFMGLNTRNIACTDDEWNSEETYLGLNFTKGLCTTKKFVLDTLFIGNTIVKNFYNQAVYAITNIFPFGLIGNINNSWQDSASSTIPENISWIGGENLTITMPGGWFGTTTNATTTLFGPAIFETGDETTADFFSKLKALSTYLLWGGFILSIYLFGQKFYYDHFTEDEKV